MNLFLQSLIALLLNVLLGGMAWKDAIQKWLEDQVAVLGSREAVESQLALIADGRLSCDCDTEIDEHGKRCCAAEPGKFGDGHIFNFLKTIDWAKFAAFIFTIINMIPKADPVPTPGPIA